MFNRRRFETIDRHLDKLELYLEIRDPGTARSAESFDQLRKQIAAAADNRKMHLADLARLDVVATNATDISTVRKAISEAMQLASLEKVDDPQHKGAFRISGESGDRLQVDAPAYVTYLDDARQMVMLVRPGSASWVSDGPSVDDLADQSVSSIDSAPGHAMQEEPAAGVEPTDDANAVTTTVDESLEGERA